MKTILFWTVIVLFMLSPAVSRADIEAGVAIDDGVIKDFHLAIGDFYKIPQDDIEIAKTRKIKDEELPVVFFLAQRAKVTPAVISELKLAGRSWLEITHFYGMGAEIYYVKAAPTNTPPYGKALGFYKNKKKSEWKYIKLSDDDIVNLVNLQFIASKYNSSPESVIKLRSGGRDFALINKDFKDGKVSKPEQSAQPTKSKGHSKKRK
jgi:hypothetical protein